MEKWQRQYITKSLPDLLELTEFTPKMQVLLKSKKALSDADCNKLKAIATTQGKDEEIKQLYDTLKTRRNAYMELGNALFQTTQSGAFLVLLKGLLLHLNATLHLDKQILDDILGKIEFSPDILQFFLNQVNQPRLVADMIPTIRNGFYIPRLISNRVKLDINIFKQKCQDVFVFKGLRRSQLTELAGSSTTILSRSILYEKKITCRFILLEEKCEDDWEEICKFGKTPTHLIRYDPDSKDYILERTCRPDDFISKYILEQSKDESLYMSEKTFFVEIDKLKNERSICICDKPGMGKTWLLENIAREMQQRHPDRLVAFISLPEFIRKIRATTHFDKTTALMVILKYVCSTNLTVNILENLLLHKKTRFEIFLDGFDEVPTDDSEWTKQFLNKIIEANCSVRLYVASRPHLRNDLEKAMAVLAYDILPFSLRNQLDFLVEFWKPKVDDIPNLEEKLEEFAAACLKHLKETLTTHEYDLMGIPLQCLLLATVNEDNARVYVRRRNTISDPSSFFTITSMYDMYQKYVGHGINKALKNHSVSEENYVGWLSKLPSKIFKTQRIKPETFHSLKSFHVWKALELLCPDLASGYFSSMGLSEQNPTLQHFACGLLQACSAGNDNTIHTTFVHRTIAEFLVAEYFSEMFTSPSCEIENEQNENLAGRILEYVFCTKESIEINLEFVFAYRGVTKLDGEFLSLHTFQNQTVTRFFNSSLNNISISSICLPLARSVVMLLKEKQLSEMLSSCIMSGFANIVQLLRFMVSTTLSSSNNTISLGDVRRLSTLGCRITDLLRFISDEEMYFLSSCAYLVTIPMYADVSTAQEIYNFFSNCLFENLDHVCSKMPTNMITPLNEAILNRRYELVEFFIKKVSLPHRCLLHQLLPDTDKETPEQLENVTEIYNLLVSTCPDLLNQWSHGYRNDQAIHPRIEAGPPVFIPRIHVRLLKSIVGNGADITGTHEQKNLVQYHADTNMKRNQFCELCRFLIVDVKALYLFKPNLPTWTNPLPSIIPRVNKQTLLQVLKVPGVYLNTDTHDSSGNNLISEVILQGEWIDVVEVLVENGVNPSCKNNDGLEPLHLAAEKGKLDAIKCLLSLGVSLETRDKKQRTPLLMAINHPKIVRYLLTVNACIFAVDCNGNSIAHTAIDSYEMQELVTCLLEHDDGKDIFKLKNGNGQTPLHHWFTSEKSLKRYIVEPILELSTVDINDVDKNGENIFLGAIRGRRTVKALQLLQKFKADHNVTNNDGRNALHLAVERGTLSTRAVDVVSYLLLVGCNADQRDIHGNTPLDDIISTEFWYQTDTGENKELISICQKLIKILSSSSADVQDPRCSFNTYCT